MTAMGKGMQPPGACLCPCCFYKNIAAMRLLFFLLISLLLFAGCKKDDPAPSEDHPEFIVFGFFQNCASESCVEIFKLEPSKLLEDTNEDVPQSNSPYNGNYSVPLSAEKYRQIELLFRNSIPDELLARPSGTVGTAPTWANNFYFEYKTGTEYKHWIIDGSFDGSLPASIQSFVNQVIQPASSIASFQ
jgi:hypothetical protein